MKATGLSLLVTITFLSVGGGALGLENAYLIEDFESMTVEDPITNYPGWSAGGNGIASGTIMEGKFLRLAGTYPSDSAYWDWVKRDISDLGLSGDTLTYAVDAGNNLVASQYWGRRVRWGIVDAAGNPLVRVEMNDFSDRLIFNGVTYDGLLSSSRLIYVFDLDFNANTVKLTRNGRLIGTEALLGGDRNVADAQALIFETGANFPNMDRFVQLNIDNIILLPEPARLGPVFVDRTAELGINPGNSASAWGDFNNDGWVDVLASDTLWQNREGTRFTSVLATGSGVMADYDNDGFLDIFSYSWRRLYRNIGGLRFSVQPLPELPINVSRGASWADHNGDGQVDLYVGGYEVWPDEEFPDVILRNDDGEFTIAWQQSSIRRARGVTSCDFNENGHMDIYVSNYRLQANLLLVNDGEGNFTDMAGHYGVAGQDQLGAFGHTIGSVWADVDNDGHFDLFVGNFSHSDWYQDRPQLYRNMGPDEDYRFELVWTMDGDLWQESYAVPTFADYNNNGRLDLYFTTVYSGDNARLFRNDGNWQFTDVTEEVGLGNMPPTYQAAWADYDNDGALDLLTGGRLYHNQGNDNNWLKVRLAGDGKYVNSSAIGAQVRIPLPNGEILTRQVEAGTGEGGQHDLTLHFGLGQHEGPLTLRITWPNGSGVQVVEGVAVNQAVEYTYRACPLGDLTGDCRVGLADLGIMASTWLSGPELVNP